MTTLWEEVAAQAAIAAKAKKATQLAETEIVRLRSELRQSSDKEADIQAKGRKAAKLIQDQLNAEIAAYGRKEERKRLREKGIKKGNIISVLEKRPKKSTTSVKVKKKCSSSCATSEVNIKGRKR